jgi:hypothetical protein
VKAEPLQPDDGQWVDAVVTVPAYTADGGENLVADRPCTERFPASVHACYTHKGRPAFLAADPEVAS